MHCNILENQEATLLILRAILKFGGLNSPQLRVIPTLYWIKEKSGFIMFEDHSSYMGNSNKPLPIICLMCGLHSSSIHYSNAEQISNTCSTH